MPVPRNSARPDAAAGADHAPRLSLRSSRDFVTAVPALLGFHPEDSVVAVGMAGGRVHLVGRVDLPPASATPLQRAAVIYRLTQPVLRDGADTIVLLGYGLAAAVTPIVDEATRLYADPAVKVLDMLRVTDGRFYSYLCRNPRCCPAEGVPFDTATSVVMAQAVVNGQVVLPDRAALVASIAPASGAAADRMRALTTIAAQRVTDLIQAEGIDAAVRAGSEVVEAAVGRYRDGGRLDDAEMALLLVHLVNPTVRDAAWLTAGDEPSGEELWRDVTRRADPRLVAAPASLLAFVAWRNGNGALADVAVARALEADPDYQLAHLMEAVLESGMPPSVLPGWSDFVAAACRDGVHHRGCDHDPDDECDTHPA